jgi:hypothetical protein
MMAQRPQRPLSGRDPRAPTGKRQGLTRLEVENLLASQGGRCALGGEPLSWDNMVDHDHVLAASHPHPVRVGCPACVRGILCRAHNSALGVFHDDPDELRRAASYVARRRP